MQQRNLVKGLVLSGLTGFLMLALPTYADSQSIGISPTSIDKTVQPGVATHGTVEVLDQGKTNYTYKVYADPYHVSDEAYDPSFTPISGVANAASWFSLGTTTGHLAASAQDTISYTITPPIGTPPGGYYAVIFAQTQGEKSSSGITDQARVGAIFYLRVPGTVAQGGKILSWQLPWLQQSPVSAALRIENIGRLHFSAAISLDVSNPLGGTKYHFTETRVVLPQTIRRIPITFTSSPQFGFFRVTGTVTYLGQTVKLPTRYVFVASPRMRLVVIGLILLAIIISLIGYRYEKRHKARART